MSIFSTKNMQGWSVKYSNRNPSLLAVVGGEKCLGYGPGHVLVFNKTFEQPEMYHSTYASLLTDICWATNDDILTSSIDGCIQIWNLHNPNVPVKNISAHRAEILSIQLQGNSLFTSSFDHTVKLWDISRVEYLKTFEHNTSVHSLCLGSTNNLATISDDGYLRLFDISNIENIATIKATDSFGLTCDWSTNDIIAIGDADGIVRCWDVKYLQRPLYQMNGADLAINQMKFSPHSPDFIALACFNKTARVVNVKLANQYEIYPEQDFVASVDWNPQNVGELTFCNWSGNMRVVQSNLVRNIRNKVILLKESVLRNSLSFIHEVPLPHVWNILYLDKRGCESIEQKR